MQHRECCGEWFWEMEINRQLTFSATSRSLSRIGVQLRVEFVNLLTIVNVRQLELSPW